MDMKKNVISKNVISENVISENVISENITIYNTDLNIFLNKNLNIKKIIHPYNQNDYACSICLGNSYDVDNNKKNKPLLKYNHCGNLYIHENCLYDWFIVNNKCILCKKSIVEHKDVVIQENNIGFPMNIFNRISYNRTRYFGNNYYEYDNETGNEHETEYETDDEYYMQHHVFIQSHPIRLPDIKFCINIMYFIPHIIIIFVLYEIISYITPFEDLK